MPHEGSSCGLSSCSPGAKPYCRLCTLGKCFWHMGITALFKLSILKPHTSMSPKIMALNKYIYMRSIHKKVPLKNTIF
jgi:hypothetical protein